MFGIDYLDRLNRAACAVDGPRCVQLLMCTNQTARAFGVHSSQQIISVFTSNISGGLLTAPAEGRSDGNEGGYYGCGDGGD